MSYNTRRSGPGVNAIGQRRQQVGNFVHGGQLNQNAKQHQQRQHNDGYQNQQHQQGQGQHQPRQNQPQQQKPPQNVSHQQAQQNAPHQQAQQQQPQQNQPQQQQQNQPPQQQQNQPPQQQQNQPPPRPNMQESAQTLVNQIQKDAPKVEEVPEAVAETPNSAAPAAEAAAVKEKPFWIKKQARVPRAERVRRRNLRLKKVLQPKNALMVLNELVGNTAYTITDSKTGYNQDIFNAVLTIDGNTFNGLGKSKVAAKTAAAETAIKAIILKRLRNPGAFNNTAQPAAADGASQNEDEKMDEEQQNEDLSWSHIASFAIHKLFSTWDEDEGGHLVESFSAISSSNIDGTSTPRTPSLTNLQTVEQKPAKKLPENAVQLNPCMLLNQMYPQAKYEETARVGNPPNVQFTISCMIDGQTFTGIGQNKKAARKQAAFEACKTLLNIDYPPDVFEPKPEPMQVENHAPF